ncbi:MAG: phosphoglycerate dehydrogenase [Deltaproteobacteria bacterium]|nr:phosphoglycerate dehydrogenase [Deltaproteobacteria bacterium]
MNPISVKGLERFPRDRYEIASEMGHPDALLVRSAKVTAAHLTPGLRAIARAGAGTDNIPVAECTKRGIPVFNAPGANANAVKELVLAGMLLSSRNLLESIRYVDSLAGQSLDDAAMHKAVEGEKKKFVGAELRGKTLGVAGLGAIGSLVAEMGLSMGMKVLGYDPAISVDAAWRLPSTVQRMENLPTLISRSDYVSLHLPLMAETRGLINKETLAFFRPDARLLNFSRDGIVEPDAVAAALENHKLGAYISDFPHPSLLGRRGVLATPHLGASTGEAEENCAMMVADQLVNFLENGNVTNSVNFPSLVLERTGGHRIALVNHHVPRMLSQVLTLLGEHNLNVMDMLNKSRDELAYNLIDVDPLPPKGLIERLAQLDGVISVWQVPQGKTP